MRVMVIPTVVGALGTDSKGLEICVQELKIRRRTGALQATALLRSANILTRMLETWGNLQSFRQQRKITRPHWCEKLARGKIIIIIIILNKKKKRICKSVDFAVPADHRINLKECEKKDKYLDLARESKKLWNMKVTIVPIVIGALCTINEGLLKGLEDLKVGGRVETIQITALLRTARILRRVLETWGDLMSPRLQWKTIC